MPELPDILVYLDCLKPRVEGLKSNVALINPFLLRRRSAGALKSDGARHRLAAARQAHRVRV